MNDITQRTTSAPSLPAWTRFPRPGEREPLTGLSRATLYRWRDAGLIVVKNVRRTGQIRGVALISVSSLLACIEQGGAAHSQTAPATVPAAT
jgi:hypothetical protein